MLQVGLKDWAAHIKKGRGRLKYNLNKKLERILQEDVNDKMLAKLINMRVHLNLEIDKD